MSLSDNYTIVTGFFDIKRDRWGNYSRNLDDYLKNAERMLSLKDNMVIFIESDLVDKVKELRRGCENSTLIVSVNISDLPYYKHKEKIQAIMDSEEFKNGLKNQVCPESTNPLYDIIMYSKTKMVLKTMSMNPFKSDRFVWLDFGVHPHMLKDEMLNKKLFPLGVPEKLKFLCREIPTVSDLNIEIFFKSNTNRFAGTMFSGDIPHLATLDKLIEDDVADAMEKNVIDCDQSFFSNVYVKRPELFDIYYGDWSQLVSNYYNYVENFEYLAYLFTKYRGCMQLINYIARNIPLKLRLDANQILLYDPEEASERSALPILETRMGESGRFLESCENKNIIFIGGYTLPDFYNNVKLYEGHPALSRLAEKNVARLNKNNITVINRVITSTANPKNAYDIKLNSLITKPSNDGVKIECSSLDDIVTDETDIVYINSKSSFDMIIKSGLKALLKNIIIIAKTDSKLIECLGFSKLSVGKYFCYFKGNEAPKFRQIKDTSISQIINLEPPPLCVKPETKTRVKLMCNWTTNKNLCDMWSKLNSSRWNLETTSGDDCDYFVIINQPLVDQKYIPEKTIVFRMEPDCETNPIWDWYSQEGLTKDKFLFFGDLSKHMNNNEWHLSLTSDQLLDSSPEGRLKFEKTKTLSAIVSGQYSMIGHQYRINLIRAYERDDWKIDIYGRGSEQYFENHSGELPYHKKDTGILPYKYHIAVENCSMENYFTEKLIDGILGECLCFYWGCSNIEKYIDPRAYIKLSGGNTMREIEDDIDLINSSIKNKEWEKRLPYIKEMKNKIINEYSFFPRIKGIIEGKL